MPILFTCPHCGTKSQVADQYAGQSGPCAACGKPVTIPYAGGGARPSSGAGAGVAIIAVMAVLGVAALCIVPILIALLLPAVQAAREAARRTQCANNLKQIGLAFHSYQDVHGCLPPAYLADKDGKPMHSWRVLILPFLEQQNLYNMYKFDEPWDSQNNLRVAEMMPRVYQCPSAVSGGRFTDYMVITGPETLFDGAKSASLNQIADGTSNTLLVVEAKGASTRWTEPVDIELAKSSLMTFGGPQGDIGSNHRGGGGAQALFADGSVKFLRKDVPPQTLKSLATKAGGEAVPGF